MRQSSLGVGLARVGSAMLTPYLIDTLRVPTRNPCAPATGNIKPPTHRIATGVPPATLSWTRQSAQQFCESMHR